VKCRTRSLYISAWFTPLNVRHLEWMFLISTLSHQWFAQARNMVTSLQPLMQLVSDCNGYAKTIGKTKKEKETRTGRKHEREVNLQRVEAQLFKPPAPPCNTVKKKCITEGNSLSSAEVRSLAFKTQVSIIRRIRNRRHMQHVTECILRF
jgi:hypothetical protein